MSQSNDEHEFRPSEPGSLICGECGGTAYVTWHVDPDAFPTERLAPSFAGGELIGSGPNDVASRTRDGRGRYDHDAESARLSARALELRAQSRSYRAIAAELGISVSTAHDAVRRGLREIVEEAAEDVRRLELDKLDALERAALDVLGRDHVTVSNGRVLDDVPDDGVTLAAIATLVRISESRRKLLGLDSPQKLSVDGGVRYEVVGVDPATLT